MGGSRYVEGCWGLLTCFVDLEIYQDSTIVKFCFVVEIVEKPIVLDPRRIQKNIQTHSICFQNSLGLIGCACVLRDRDFQKHFYCSFQVSETSKTPPL